MTATLLDYRRLTPSEIDKLRTLYSDPSISYAEIAARLNITKEAVKSRVRTLRLPRRRDYPRPRRTAQQETLLRTLWADATLTRTEIARLLGVVPWTVTAWAVDLQLPVRPSPPPGRGRIDPDRLRAVWSDQGWTQRQIAAEFGVSVRTAIEAAAHLGLPVPRPVRGQKVTDDAIRAAWDEPISVAESARRLNVSESMLSHRAKMLGLPSRRGRIHTDPRLPELWADESLSLTAIADALDVSRDTVRRHAAVLGLAGREPLGGSVLNFVGANERRTAAAGPRQAAQVAAALAALDAVDVEIPAETRRVATARVEHPTWSLAELADSVGATKDATAGRLRRLLDASWALSPGPFKL
jgi:biotin operon repressor